MSLAIELLQIITYRATDVNDIIANTFGTVVGNLIFTIVSHFIPAMKNLTRRKNEIAVVALSLFVVMFFIQPYLATLFYTIM